MKIKRLHRTKKIATNIKLVNFQVFSDSAHQAELKNTKVIYD